jgi:cysteine-rich repeat protein
VASVDGPNRQETYVALDSAASEGRSTEQDVSNTPDRGIQQDGGDWWNIDSLLGADTQVKPQGSETMVDSNLEAKVDSNLTLNCDSDIEFKVDSNIGVTVDSDFEVEGDAGLDIKDSQVSDSVSIGGEIQDTGISDALYKDIPSNTDTAGLAGQSCSAIGALACAAPNQQLSIICSGGKWQVLSTCAAGQRCDHLTGVCADVVSDCAGHDPGYSLCINPDTAETCGADLVTVTSTTCSGICQAGACQVSRCGDGKVEGTETCDDGNTVSGDGCEPDCSPTQVLKLVAGRAHTCALLSKGNVRCWGANEKGQLGLGNVEDREAKKPYQNGLVALGSAAMAIAAGADHTCALMADYSIQCWGANDHGQLGLGHTNPIGDDELPSADVAKVQLGLGVKTLASGGNVTCAILSDDTLRCWGQNDFGQLGLGHTQDVGVNESPSQMAAQVSIGGSAKLVATGGNHTCTILSDGYTLRCWGLNGLGQLGLGITQNVGDNELPTDVNAVAFPTDGIATSAMASIVVGSSRACALRLDGIGRCWGDNSDGGLGVAYIGAMPNNTALDWGIWSWSSAILEFSEGSLHTCASMADNQLRCWGLNGKAQLGLANTDSLGDYLEVFEVLPINLGIGADGGASYAKTTAAGAAHTCVILGDGNVRCWGANESGQLGLGYKSLAPNDFVGGSTSSTPDNLDLVLVTHS